MKPESEPVIGAPAPALGRSVGSGATWFGVATILTRIASFIAQVLLGWWLDEKQFGVFALAITIASFLSIIRDGGVRDLIVHRGAAFGRDDDGPLFWIAFAFNMVLAAVMASVGGLFARFYGTPELAPMLWIMAASIPISTLGSMYHARLRIQLRFRQAAMWTMWPAMVRFGSTIAFAAAGMGVYSFAWPWILVAIAESVLGWWYVRERVWTLPPKLSRWPALLREVRWLLLARLSEVGLSHGEYLVAGKLLTLQAVGIFFFAFQLVAQTSLLLSTNLQAVLLPALSRLASERERFANALHRAMRVQAMWSSVLCFGLASVVAPLEGLLWQGRWANAVPAMIILTIAFPMRVTTGVTTAALQAQGRFKAVGVSTALEAIGYVLAAWAGSIVAQRETDPMQESLILAAALTAYIIISRMIVCAWVFKASHLRRRGAAMDLFPAWMIGIVCCGAAIALDYRVLTPALVDATPILAWAARFLVCGFVFTALFMTTTRLIIRPQLADAVDVLPNRLQARLWARRLLWLPID